MKKFYQLIAVAGLSLLTIGASAQNAASTKFRPTPKAIRASDRFAKATHNTSKRATGTGQDVLIDYLAGDVAITGGTFFNWSPYLILNSAYTIADSGTTYNYASNAAIETIDSLYDLYTGSFVTPIVAGTVTVDTITAEVHYHNTSTLNDTILFIINAVDVNGLPNPAGAVYGVDTAVITPGFFTNNVLDSISTLQIIKSINIPSTARKGYNFAITMTVKGSKMDTIGVVYYSQGSNNCAALGGYYTPAPSSIGVANGACRAGSGSEQANSFVDGLYYQNDKGQHGTNVAMLWPLTSGANQGYCSNGGGYYSSPLDLTLVGFTSCTGDTNWFGVQDLAIFPSINIGTVGINSIKDVGFSVAQNAPNPFNQNSQINYNLTKESDVMFSIYDLTGRKLVESNYSKMGAGQHVINLSANQFTPGVYFYSFHINGNVVTKRMVITE